MRIRNNKVNVFLSDDEKFILKRASSKLNLSQSEYIRNLIVGYEIKIPEEQQQCFVHPEAIQPLGQQRIAAIEHDTLTTDNAEQAHQRDEPCHMVIAQQQCLHHIVEALIVPGSILKPVGKEDIACQRDAVQTGDHLTAGG